MTKERAQVATYKNVSGIRLDIPLYDLHVDTDETFEVPDDQAEFFDAQPVFAKSRTTSPTYVSDVDAGQVAVTEPTPAADPAVTDPSAPSAPAN